MKMYRVTISQPDLVVDVEANSKLEAEEKGWWEYDERGMNDAEIEVIEYEEAK